MESLIREVGDETKPCLADVDEEMGAQEEEQQAGIHTEGWVGEAQGEDGCVGGDMSEHGVPFFTLERGHPGILEPVVSQKVAGKEEKRFVDEKKDGGHDRNLLFWDVNWKELHLHHKEF